MERLTENGACAHFVMVSKFQWKPFWLATPLDPQNGWTGWQIFVNNDVFAQAPLLMGKEQRQDTPHATSCKAVATVHAEEDGGCVHGH